MLAMNKKSIRLPFYTTLLAMAIILLRLSPGSSSVLEYMLYKSNFVSLLLLYVPFIIA